MKSTAKERSVVEIDPAIVRFTHSRIRPYFTGCGKKVSETIEELKNGQITVDDLPMITELRSMGLLENNLVKVRIKTALPREAQRYTPDRCSLTATIMKEHESEDDSDKLLLEENADDKCEGKEPDHQIVADTIVKLPKLVLQSVRHLTLLTEKGKKKQVKETIQHWKEDETLTEEQCRVLMDMIGLD